MDHYQKFLIQLIVTSCLFIYSLQWINKETDLQPSFSPKSKPSLYNVTTHGGGPMRAAALRTTLQENCFGASA
jgi:hypothetical protein